MMTTLFFLLLDFLLVVRGRADCTYDYNGIWFTYICTFFFGDGLCSML